jgi:hypothetical protein
MFNDSPLVTIVLEGLTAVTATSLVIMSNVDEIAGLYKTPPFSGGAVYAAAKIEACPIVAVIGICEEIGK